MTAGSELAPADDEIDAPALARRVVRRTDHAALAVVYAGGAPYASLVAVGLDPEGRPLMLLSGLAEHSRALERDPRVALLFDGTAGLADRLAGPRVTIMGRAGRLEPSDRRDRLLERFLRRHPAAAVWAGFADFDLWRVAVTSGRLIGGFGRIRSLVATDLLVGPAPDLAVTEQDIVAHMNEDHADVVALCCEVLLGLPAGEWRMTGIDREGADFRLDGRVARVDFARPIDGPDGARQRMIGLARSARAWGTGA